MVWLPSPPVVVRSGKSQKPEVFFGLASAIGTDLQPCTAELTESLSAVGYESQIIHIPDLIKKRPENEDKYFDRVNCLMDGGNELRKNSKNNGILAVMSILNIRRLREKNRLVVGEPPKTDKEDSRYNDRTIRKLHTAQKAYILDSLKHPDEIEVLRRVYGPSFHLISVYSPRESRIQNMAHRIASTQASGRAEDYRDQAEQLLSRDQMDKKEKWGDSGQQLRKVFHKADLFVEETSRFNLRKQVSKYIELVFGNTLYTPTRHEYAMNIAAGSALRSSSLSRQVGAAIAKPDGSILSVSANEVPKPGGGEYWEGDVPDGREFAETKDVNEEMRNSILQEIIESIDEKKLLREGVKSPDVIKKILKEVESARVLHLNEFGRTVHAEMSALLSAARNGVNIKDGTLYSTTFPCHECTRHIISSGIKEVYYIEPYPKSYASELFTDQIVVDAKEIHGEFVHYRAFVGISPRRFTALYAMGKRKKDGGEVMAWNAQAAAPRDYRPPEFYVMREASEISKNDKFLEKIVDRPETKT